MKIVRNVLLKFGIVLLLGSIISEFVSKVFYSVDVIKDPRLISFTLPRKEVYDAWTKSWYVQNPLFQNLEILLPVLTVIGCAIILICYPRESKIKETAKEGGSL